MEKIAVMYSGGVDSTLVADMAATEAGGIFFFNCIFNCYFKKEKAGNAFVSIRPRGKIFEKSHPNKKVIHIIFKNKKN